jgi:hypothetical protein
VRKRGDCEWELAELKLGRSVWGGNGCVVIRLAAGNISNISTHNPGLHMEFQLPSTLPTIKIQRKITSIHREPIRLTEIERRNHETVNISVLAQPLEDKIILTAP